MTPQIRTETTSRASTFRVLAITTAFLGTCLLMWTMAISCVLGLFGFEAAMNFGKSLGPAVLQGITGVLLMIFLHRRCGDQ